MNKIRFVDLNRQHADIKIALKEAVLKVVESGVFIGGEEVKSFEKEMASWLGVGEIVGVGCATSGLFSVLKCAGIGPGNEVITTVHTAIATLEAIHLAGATPVICDIGDGSYNLDLNQLETKINSRTKALIPVHLYGQPVDMDRVMKIAAKHGLFVLEDCAQAQGALFGEKKVGSIGDAAVFSFFPSKTMGGFGDGGAVTAKNPELMKKIRMFCNHGREKKYYHEFMGTNSRLDAIQAAMLRICLRKLDEWNQMRREAASWYNSALGGLKDVRIPSTISGTTPVYHVYVIVVPDREAMIKYLKEKGIETAIHYPYSLNVLPALSFLGQGEGSLPRAEYACSHMLSLPLYPGVRKDEVEFVCDEIKNFLNR